MQQYQRRAVQPNLNHTKQNQNIKTKIIFQHIVYFVIIII